MNTQTPTPEKLPEQPKEAAQSSTKETSKLSPSTKEIGYIISNRGYLSYLDGLPGAKVYDVVENEKGLKGLVSALQPNQIEVLILDEGEIIPGEKFFNTGNSLNITVGDFLLGRSINPLGVPIDGKGLIDTSTKKNYQPLEQEARGIGKREFITEQLESGITLVDSLIPLGKGQRELIIGDGNSGIADFLIDMIINQNKNQVICVYAVIGKPVPYIKNLLNTLQANQALAHTVVIATSATENPPLIFLTPKAAFTVAEFFQNQGKDVLVILDDMGNHARTYREIALLGGRAPGRESYPGDIFYQQAHLLERAGKFNKEAGGGSITALPVIELNLVDFTGFIPTNLMAITDGHLLFKSNLYNKNQRPAIDISLSVSRVGRQTQHIVNNLLSRKVRQVLAQAAEYETLARFSAELPVETQLILRQQQLINEILRQDNLTAIPLSVQTVLLGLVFTSFLHDKNEVFMRKNKAVLIKGFTTEPQLIQITKDIYNLKTDTELIQQLEGLSAKLNELCK